MAQSTWPLECESLPTATSEATPTPMDEQSFGLLYRATARALRSYVLRALGNPLYADDIVQESYLRLLRRPVRVDEPDQQRALLFRIASNLMIDHWRKRRREAPLPPDSIAQAARPDPDGNLRIDMQRVFQRLSPRQRQLMWLVYVEGADHRQVAAMLGLRERSVRVLLHRARRKLAGLIEQNSGEQT